MIPILVIGGSRFPRIECLLRQARTTLPASTCFAKQVECGHDNTAAVAAPDPGRGRAGPGAAPVDVRAAPRDRRRPDARAAAVTERVDGHDAAARGAAAAAADG